MDSKNSLTMQSMVIQNDPALFKEGAVFIGRVDKTEFKVLKVYEKGDAITEFSVADTPMVKLVATKTGKTQIRSLNYLCHLLLDYKGEEKMATNKDVEAHSSPRSMDLSTFVLVGSSRLEAYGSFMNTEMGFDNPKVRNLMDFQDFCKELSLGYGKSSFIEIARLYEAPDGKIYYDTQY